MADTQVTIGSDPNVARVRRMLLERSALGIRKYGGTTAGLGMLAAAQHLLEELCDAAVYQARLVAILEDAAEGGE